MILLAVAAHGATGTWLDEIISLGLPVVLFIALWWWSTRKEKDKKPTARAKAETKK